MPAANPASMELALKSICLALVPFLLPATGGDPAQATAVIADMIRAYEPADMTELDLIGRLVGFGLAAMDNIRRSIADPDMPAATVLRYRSAAASLSRSAETCRAALKAGRAASQPEGEKKKAPRAATAPRSQAQSAYDAAREKAYRRAPFILENIARLHGEWDTPAPATAPPGAPAGFEPPEAAARLEETSLSDDPDRGQPDPTPRLPPQRVLLPLSR